MGRALTDAQNAKAREYLEEALDRGLTQIEIMARIHVDQSTLSKLRHGGRTSQTVLIHLANLVERGFEAYTVLGLPLPVPPRPPEPPHPSTALLPIATEPRTMQLAERVTAFEYGSEHTKSGPRASRELTAAMKTKHGIEQKTRAEWGPLFKETDEAMGRFGRKAKRVRKAKPHRKQDAS